jgi:pre-mycofactocin synthase
LAQPLRAYGHILDLSVPNMALPGQPAPTFFAAYGERMQTLPPQWDDVDWVRREWDGPLLLKGVTHPGCLICHRR